MIRECSRRYKCSVTDIDRMRIDVYNKEKITNEEKRPDKKIGSSRI